MPEIPKALRVRSLLTDTLPYEVPVIFSNDKLHAALSATMPPQIERLWKNAGGEESLHNPLQLRDCKG